MLRQAHRGTEKFEFFPRLDKFILKYDKSRPISHDGSSANSKAFSMYHVHNEENYDVLLKHWNKKKPLLFGEFWIGGRAAEMRLINGDEFFSQDDYIAKNNHLWTQKIEQMRKDDASGIGPYKFFKYLFKDVRRGKETKDKAAPDVSETVNLTLTGQPREYELDKETFKTFRHLLGKYFVTFSQKNRLYYADSNNNAVIEVYLRSDSYKAEQLNLKVIVDGQTTERIKVLLEPAEGMTRTFTINLSTSYQKKHVVLELLNSQGQVLDVKERDIFLYRRDFCKPALKSDIWLVQSKWTKEYANYLKNKNVPFNKIAAGEIDSLPPRVILIGSSDIVANSPSLLETLKQKEVCAFFTEGDLNVTTGLGPIKVFSLKMRMTNEDHFIDILNKKTTTDDIYYTSESVRESDIHPVLKNVPVDYISGLSSDQIKVSEGIIVHPHCKLQNIKADLKDIVGVNPVEDNITLDGVYNQGYIFRSLLTGSRREYSVLGELAGQSNRLIVSRLFLSESLNLSPLADILFCSSLEYLDSVLQNKKLFSTNPSRVTIAEQVSLIDAQQSLNAEKLKPVIIIHNLENLSDAVRQQYNDLLGDVELKELDQKPNHISFLQRGFFSSSKLLTLEGQDFKKALYIAPETRIKGGYQLMDIGPKKSVAFFPWKFNSPYPQQMGYAALQFEKDGHQVLLFVENIFDEKGSTSKKYLNIITNVLDNLI